MRADELAPYKKRGRLMRRTVHTTATLIAVAAALAAVAVYAAADATAQIRAARRAG